MSTQQHPDDGTPANSLSGGDLHRPADGERVITFADMTWTVYEVVDKPSDTSTLVFFSSESARRIRRYPKHWRTLSDRELYLLSWSL